MAKKENYSKGFRTKAVKVKTAKGRKLSSTNWLRRQLNDPYTQLARQQGYIARSAYKILEIDDKFSLLKAKNNIIDLGCAPGGWTQVIKERNNNAKVVAVDLLDIELNGDFHFIKGDFTDPEVQKQIIDLMPKIDLIISDIAPKTSGIANTDCLRLLSIAEDVFAYAEQHLEQGGDIALKLFMGVGFEDYVKLLRQNFSKVSSFKPNSSRKDSKELYMVAKGFLK